jgi:hypothetical protein
MSHSSPDHSRFRASGRIASLLAAALLAWPVVLHTGCQGGSTGVDNPGLAELPVEFRDEVGDVVLVRGSLEIYDQDHNPALDTAPLLRRPVEDGPGLRLTAGDFDRILAERTPKISSASKRTAAAGPAASDSLIRFNLVFRGASGSGAMTTGLSYDPVHKRFLLQSGASAGIRMLPKPLIRFAGSLHREAVHGALGRIILPGTPFQATLADSDFVLEGLTEGRFPMRLLDGDGYMFAVRESLDTHAGHAFTAGTDPIGRVDGITPPAGFGVEAGLSQSVFAGTDVELLGQLLGADSNDSRVSIRWRFLDKAPGDSARIVDPTRLRILIRFPAVSTYSLELAATFGATTVQDTLFLKVSPPVAGKMKFTHPLPGDSLVHNQPYKVAWEYADADLVRLEVSYKEGSWSLIADSIPNMPLGVTYMWTPPQSGVPFNNCLLRLMAIPSDSVLGVMTAPFILNSAP